MEAVEASLDEGVALVELEYDEKPRLSWCFPSELAVPVEVLAARALSDKASLVGKSFVWFRWQ